MEVGQRDPRAAIEAVYRRRYGKFLRVAFAILRDSQRTVISAIIPCATCGGPPLRSLTKQSRV